ncbi:MAG: hypothetical protein J2P29_09505 [Actinobacteria bacterium]|nr:hypothetical protein [Actinomycetota bacterium]
MSQLDTGPQGVQPGTRMQKPIPPDLVEPYLTGGRSVISGFVFRVADSNADSVPEFRRVFGIDYEGSGFSLQADEIYLLRWQAVCAKQYLVPYSAERGGDWVLPPPFTGTGYVAAGDRRVPEFFADPMPVPIGAEIHRVGADKTEFIARYNGQLWMPSAEGRD